MKIHRSYHSCLILTIGLLLGSCKNATQDSRIDKIPQKPAEYAMVIHGGAGSVVKRHFSDEREAEYRKVLGAVLDKGKEMLENGSSAIDVVEQAIMTMEDSPLFNAGRGAVFTHAGTNELDASIMHGAKREAGAVGGVTNVKNPIRAARAVMEESPHVLMVGKGAEAFAASQGIEQVDPSYFALPSQLDRLKQVQADEKKKEAEKTATADAKHGTVGCVVLDKAGNIVAATSTGGMTNKRYNRIGDSPIIGAGTYADNEVCGVSCTGHGEFYIRYAVAYDLAARVAYLGESLDKAAQTIIHEKLKNAGGAGGLIALDKYGNITMPFNTPGMFRGYVKPEERVVRLYGE